MEGYTETVAGARREIDDDLVENYSLVMEEFAEEHALWAVPPSELVWLFHNYVVSEAESEQQ